MTKADLDRKLGKLARTVRGILLPQNGGQVRTWESETPFAETVRATEGTRNTEELVRSLLLTADLLLKLRLDGSVDGRRKLRDWHGQWYAGGVSDPAISEVVIESLYVKSLAAIWLGLYFLGVPFGHPWERVRRWEDEKGGGLPSGACVAKAIGDIVRSARKRAMHKTANMLGEPAEQKVVEPNDGEDTTDTLVILSGWPIIIFKDLLVDRSGPDGAEDCASTLGRYYELLQLILYCRRGLPINYFVSEEVVARVLGVWSAKEDVKEGTRVQWREACEWLRSSVFNGCGKDGQAVYVIHEPKTPPCFINHSEGLFTYEQFKGAHMTELPMSASYMREVRRALYAQTFGDKKAPELESWRNLLSKDNDETRLFEGMWTRFNCPPG
ncbi:hypothetical protein [Paraburkholderia sp. MM5477-R1]|uniref:hypothetical protein n=1 Tax=Paraburkholderia sp. MM5477-R1 TaxID=2991062 RepID=UPI003D214F9C